jgi:phage baseplate assembly protein V
MRRSSYLSERDALRTMLRRAAIAAVNDAGAQQLVDVTGLAAEKLKAIVRIQDFGFASNPPAGGNGLIVCPGGRSDKAMFFGGEHPNYRPKNLPVGAVEVYDALGQYLGFLPSGVTLKCAKPLTIVAPQGATIQGNAQIDGNLNVTGIISWSHGTLGNTAAITGDLTATGTVTGQTDVVAGTISGKTHDHSGVQTGSGVSGPPVP